MTKFFQLLFFIPIIIFGCKTREIDDNINGQSIERLNMVIFSDQGKKMLKVKSPYSIFNKDKNTFNLKQTNIKLYKDDQIEYSITSDTSYLSNNNKLLELNGNVLVESLIQQGNKIYANSFKWSIQNSEYLLIGDVKFENNSITLRSNKAILNKANNIIEFFNPVKYLIKDSNNESAYEINSENAYYNIDNKSVKFSAKEERVRSKIYF